jgi:hypothetical protein
MRKWVAEGWPLRSIFNCALALHGCVPALRGPNRSNPLSSQRTPPTPARATPLRTLLRLVLRTQSRSGGIAAPHRPSEHSIVKREDVTRMVQSRFFRPSLPSPFRVFRVFRGQIWIGVGSCRVAVILGA